MKFNFYPEACCDDCGDIIHTHFDCPACKKEYASTSIYGEIHDEVDLYLEFIEFECQNCHALFKATNFNDIDSNEWEWKQI